MVQFGFTFLCAVFLLLSGLQQARSSGNHNALAILSVAMAILAVAYK